MAGNALIIYDWDCNAVPGIRQEFGSGIEHELRKIEARSLGIPGHHW